MYVYVENVINEEGKSKVYIILEVIMLILYWVGMEF